MVKIEIVLKNVDYGEIIYKILPDYINKIKDQEDASKIIQILSGMVNVPGTIAKAALSVLPQEIKDELLVRVVNIYNEELLEKINTMLSKNELPADVVELWSKKV